MTRDRGGRRAAFPRRISGAVVMMAAMAWFALDGCRDATPGVLRVGTNVWPGYEPLYLARNRNYFDSRTVRLVDFASGTQVVRAFRNGVVDAAALTLDAPLQKAVRGREVSLGIRPVLLESARK